MRHKKHPGYFETQAWLNYKPKPGEGYPVFDSLKVARKLRQIERTLDKPLEKIVAAYRKRSLEYLKHNDAEFFKLCTRGEVQLKQDRYGVESQGEGKTSPIFCRLASPLQNALVETRAILDIRQTEWAAYLGVNVQTIARAEMWNTTDAHSPHYRKNVSLPYVMSAHHWLSQIYCTPPLSMSHWHIPTTKRHLLEYIWCREHDVPYADYINGSRHNLSVRESTEYRTECIRRAVSERKAAIVRRSVRKISV